MRVPFKETAEESTALRHLLRRESTDHADAAKERMVLHDGIAFLPVNPDADYVADEIISRSMLPLKARLDALHIATAALAVVQYLLTLNCRHIANAHEVPRVYQLLDGLGLSGMLNCTPFTFLGEDNDGTK